MSRNIQVLRLAPKKSSLQVAQDVFISLSSEKGMIDADVLGMDIKLIIG